MKQKYFYVIKWALFFFLTPHLLLGMEAQNNKNITPRYMEKMSLNATWIELPAGYDFSDEIYNDRLSYYFFAGDMSLLDFSKVKRFTSCDFSLAFWSDRHQAKSFFQEKYLSDVTLSGDISLLGLEKAIGVSGIDLVDVPEEILLSQSCQKIFKNDDFLFGGSFSGDFTRLGPSWYTGYNNEINKREEMLLHINMTMIPNRVLRKEEFRGLFSGISATGVYLGGDVSLLGLKEARCFHHTDFRKIPDYVLVKPEMTNILKGKNVSYAQFRGNIRFLGLKGALEFFGIDLRQVSEEALLSKELNNLFKGRTAYHVKLGGNISQLGLKDSLELEGLDLWDVPNEILIHENLRNLFSGKNVKMVRFKGDIRHLGFRKALSFTIVNFSHVPEEIFQTDEMRDFFENKDLDFITITGNIFPMGLHKAKSINRIKMEKIDLSDYPREMIPKLFSKITTLEFLSFSKRQISDLYGPLNTNSDFRLLFSGVHFLGKETPPFPNYSSVIFVRDILDINWVETLNYINEKKISCSFSIQGKKNFSYHKMHTLLKDIKYFQDLYIKFEYKYEQKEETQTFLMGQDFTHLGTLFRCIFTYGFSKNDNDFSLEGNTRRIFLSALAFNKDLLMENHNLCLGTLVLNRKFLLYYTIKKEKDRRPIHSLLQRLYTILQVTDSKEVFFYKFFDIIFKKDLSEENKSIVKKFLENPLLLDEKKYFQEEFTGKSE